MSTTTRPLMPAKLRDFRDRALLLPLLRKDVASNGPAWLPLVMVLAAIAAVAYADHLVVSLSLVYLYILPLILGKPYGRRCVGFYADGVTEAENRLGEEFGMKRLSETVLRNASF